MERNEFWLHIQSAHEQSQGNMDEKCELIKTAIEAMSPDKARAFSSLFEQAMQDAYTWELWGAAYVINGGCGDDTFSDFRAALVSRGRKIFEKAVEKPDSLTDEEFDEESWFYEGFQYAVHEAVESVSGESPLAITQMENEPTGEQWEEEPEILKAKYPALWKKFEYIWMVPGPPEPGLVKPWWKFW